MSDAQKVKTFTEESTGNICPTRPTLMTKESVSFIIRMVFSEMSELACTVARNEQERDAILNNAMETMDPCTKFLTDDKTEEEVIGEQFDALVDSWYYSLNIASKHGVNLSSIFDIVHNANMAKRDPETGTFLRRESDGKVLKPVGWKSPDITQEIVRQKEHGPF